MKKNQKLKIKNQNCILFVICLFYIGIYTSSYAEEVYIYNSRGKRDPFVPLVGVNVKTAESLEDVMSIDDVKLQGIAGGSGGEKVAILNGEMIKEGETTGRVTIKKILRDKVVLLIDEDEYELNIYEERVQ